MILKHAPHSLDREDLVICYPIPRARIETILLKGIVERVGIAGTIYDVPGIVARDSQQTLAIRWILKQLSNNV